MTQSTTKPLPLQVYTCTTECNLLTNRHNVRKLTIETPISYIEWYVLADVLEAYKDLQNEVETIVKERCYVLSSELFGLEWQGDQDMEMEMIYHSVLQEIFLCYQQL